MRCTIKVIGFYSRTVGSRMRALCLRSLLVHSTILCIVVVTGDPPHPYRAVYCHAEESAAAAVNDDLTRALNAIRRDKRGILEGFQILGSMDLGDACPDQLLALVHVEGECANETIWRLGRLIVARKLTISGEQLAAEYQKAGKTGRRARRAVCAFAAYQTHRRPPRGFGYEPVLAKPKPLDEETVKLLALALSDDDPAVRVAAADSVRLAGICDDRFFEPLLIAIDDENAVVSDAASLAAAELGHERSGPLILRRLKADLKDPKGARRDDLAACGLPLAPVESMHLWGDYYSPRCCGGGWVVALGMLRYRPALTLLREMAAPQTPTEEEMEYVTGGECRAGWADDLAKAILEIENEPHRPAALLQLAEDKTLAGDVRATALRIFDDCDFARQTPDPATGGPILPDCWHQYYEPEILGRVVTLIDDESPITDRKYEPSRMGRLAIEVAANRFDPRQTYYQARLHWMGKPSTFGGGTVDDGPPSVDPVLVYPENVLSIRRQLQEKLQSLLPGRDSALALEALAVACPKWGTRERYVDIASDSNRQPLVRVAAANLLTRQPMFLEIDGGGIHYGMNAPPDTASRLLPLLSVRGKLSDWSDRAAVTRVFLDFLGYPDSELTDEQKAIRTELLPKLRAMRDGPHEEAALSVLLDAYGFTRASKAWDSLIGDPADRPKPPPPDETEADLLVGPPVEVAARRSFGFRNGIRVLTLAQNGKTLLVGDGLIRGHASESRIILLEPRDLSEKAGTSISEKLPWSTCSAVPAPDGRHVLVFNRLMELDSLKTVSVLDIRKAVALGNVRPEPLAISPDGRSALVHVSSYLSSKHGALALFDLASGSLERVIDVDELQPVSGACFLNDKEIAVHGSRGCVLAVNLENGRQPDLCDHGPRTIPSPGANWRMAVFAEGRYLVVSGYNEFVVIDISRGKEVFRREVERGNAVPVLAGRLLLYQDTKRDESMLPRLVFSCARVSDGKVVAEFSRDRSYDTLMHGEQKDIVYGVDRDTLCRLRFDWGKLRHGR